MSKQIDWLPIKLEYVQTNTTMRELAKKNNIELSTVGRKSSEENWPEQRKQFQLAIEQKANGLQTNQRAEYLTIRNNECSFFYKEVFNVANSELNRMIDETNNGKEVDLVHLLKILNVMEKARKNERIEEGQPYMIQQLEIPENSVNIYQNKKPYTNDEMEQIAYTILDGVKELREIEKNKKEKEEI